MPKNGRIRIHVQMEKSPPQVRKPRGGDDNPCIYPGRSRSAPVSRKTSIDKLKPKQEALRSFPQAALFPSVSKR